MIQRIRIRHDRHVHRWATLGVQPIALMFCPPSTAVLQVCNRCGFPQTVVIQGVWSMGDFTRGATILGEVVPDNRAHDVMHAAKVEAERLWELDKDTS